MKGSIIWVGMDAHARSVMLAEVAGDGREPVVRRLSSEPKKLEDVFAKLSKRGRVQCCYEAGP